MEVPARKNSKEPPDILTEVVESCNCMGIDMRGTKAMNHSSESFAGIILIIALFMAEPLSLLAFLIAIVILFS